MALITNLYFLNFSLLDKSIFHWKVKTEQKLPRWIYLMCPLIFFLFTTKSVRYQDWVKLLSRPGAPTPDAPDHSITMHSRETHVYVQFRGGPEHRVTSLPDYSIITQFQNLVAQEVVIQTQTIFSRQSNRNPNHKQLLLASTALHILILFLPSHHSYPHSHSHTFFQVFPQSFSIQSNPPHKSWNLLMGRGKKKQNPLCRPTPPVTTAEQVRLIATPINKNRARFLDRVRMSGCNHRSQRRKPPSAAKHCHRSRRSNTTG